MELDIKENWKELGTLFYLYIGKLAEFGLITNGPESLTSAGFDIAIDSYDNGVRLTEKQVLGFLRAEKMQIKEEQLEKIAFLIIRMQTM